MLHIIQKFRKKTFFFVSCFCFAFDKYFLLLDGIGLLVESVKFLMYFGSFYLKKLGK